MTLIGEARSSTTTLRTLISDAQGLTCEKQGLQGSHARLRTPRNPGRSRSWRPLVTQPCTLILAA